MLSVIVSVILLYPVSAAISGRRSLMKWPENTFVDLTAVENQVYRLNFVDIYKHTIGDMSTSGLGGHIAISDVGRCRNHCL